MAVIAILKRKGGVGASTLAVNLAGEFQRRGRKPMVLDCDAQHSASAWSQFEGGAGLRELVEAVDTERPTEFRSILERAASVAELVIVDAAPGFPVTALLAAEAADLVLLPCGPSPLDLEPARDAMEVALTQRRDRKEPGVWFVPSRNLPRTRLGRELPETLAMIGEPYGVGVLPGITQRVAVAESVLCGQSIAEYEPDGEAAREFAELATALEGRLA